LVEFQPSLSRQEFLVSLPSLTSFLDIFIHLFSCLGIEGGFGKVLEKVYHKIDFGFGKYLPLIVRMKIL
jgi:hypothetical protein